jgi:hypothetical protein
VKYVRPRRYVQAPEEIAVKCAEIRAASIQCHQHPPLTAVNFRNTPVVVTDQLLIVNREGVVSGVVQ